MAKYRTGFAVALIVLILDQLTKWLVTGPLGINQLGDQLVLLPIFNFTYTENNGISLGLLNATTETGRWMLVALTSAIAIGMPPTPRTTPLTDPLLSFSDWSQPRTMPPSRLSLSLNS